MENKGFTLIETIIYIGLFFIVIGGGMVGAYQIIQSTDRTQSKTILEQDANFILRKIDWALTGFSINSTSPNLSINKTGFTQNPIIFSLSGNNFQIKKGSNPATILNNSRIKISNPTFKPITSPGKPDGVKVTFTVTTLDDKISQQFTITKYER